MPTCPPSQLSPYHCISCTCTGDIEVDATSTGGVCLGCVHTLRSTLCSLCLLTSVKHSMRGCQDMVGQGCPAKPATTQRPFKLGKTSKQACKLCTRLLALVAYPDQSDKKGEVGERPIEAGCICIIGAKTDWLGLLECWMQDHERLFVEAHREMPKPWQFLQPLQRLTTRRQPDAANAPSVHSNTTTCRPYLAQTSTRWCL